MEEFSEYQAIAPNGMAIHGSDKGAIVRFEQLVEPDEEKTKETGVQQYKTTEIIYIRFAGQRDEMARPVLYEDTATQISDLKRFPRQWEAYKNQTKVVHDGVPLEHWPPLNKAQVLQLKSMDIHTVEQLSCVSDANLTWMGARQMRDNAVAWLEEAKSGAEVMKLKMQNEELQKQLLAMKNQLDALAGQVKKPEVKAEPVVAPEPEPEIAPIKRTMRKNNG